MKRMLKLSLLFVVMVLAAVLAENDVVQQGLIHQIRKGAAGPNPYIFLTVPQSRSQSVIQGFEVNEENDDKQPLHEGNDNNDEEAGEEEQNDENDNDDEDEKALSNNFDNGDGDEHERQLNDENLAEDAENNNETETEADDFDNALISNLKLRSSANRNLKAKRDKLMITPQYGPAIMIPHKTIEIDGRSIIDETSGKPVLLLPRSVLDSIPDGSIVAVVQRPVNNEPEGPAKRRHKQYRVIQQSANIRRPNNLKRRKVITVRRRNGCNGNKRRVNRRRVYLED